MKLYELTNDFQRLFDSLEDMTESRAYGRGKG